MYQAQLVFKLVPLRPHFPYLQPLAVSRIRSRVGQNRNLPPLHTRILVLPLDALNGYLQNHKHLGAGNSKDFTVERSFGIMAA